jgi:hypothetical protein
MPRLTSAPCCAGRTCRPATAGCRSTGAAAGACAARRSPIAGLNDFLNRQYGMTRTATTSSRTARSGCLSNSSTPRGCCTWWRRRARNAYRRSRSKRFAAPPSTRKGTCCSRLPTASPCSATAICLRLRGCLHLPNGDAGRRCQRARRHAQPLGPDRADPRLGRISACRSSRCADPARCRVMTLWLSLPRHSNRWRSNGCRLAGWTMIDVANNCGARSANNPTPCVGPFLSRGL